MLHFQEQIKRPIALSVRPPINLYISQFLTLVRSFHYALPIAHHDDMQHCSPRGLKGNRGKIGPVGWVGAQGIQGASGLRGIQGRLIQYFKIQS